MSSPRDDLLTSYREGNFLQAVFASSSNKEERTVVASELVSLHNEKLIDVVSAFEPLKRTSPAGINFFLMLRTFENVLSEIEAPVLPVMRCVLHLWHEAGQDGVAGMILNSFTSFCGKASVRVRAALREIERDPEAFADLLPATISAAPHNEVPLYLADVIRLSGSANIELRRSAVFSLARINLQGDSILLDSAFSSLEKITDRETDDHIRAFFLLTRICFCIRRAETTTIVRM